jgi:glycosyltransferase involved in cell wall biosynthesis
MAASPYLSVIVPAYNEVASIERTLKAIGQYLDRQPWSYEVIVSADGTDGTREKVAEIAKGDERVSVIGTAERGGKGRGVRNGIFKAAGQVIGFLDADYKTPIEELDKVLPWLQQGYEVVVGSRKVDDARVEVPQALYRRLGSKAFGFVRNALVGLGDIRDTQCGFKFFQRGAAKAVFSRQRVDGYMFDVEILYLARQLGYRIKEVGVRWQDDGDSRSNLVGGTWKHARDLLRIRFTDYSDSHRAAQAPAGLGVLAEAPATAAATGPTPSGNQVGRAC